MKKIKNTLDNTLIARLVGYRRIDEDGEQTLRPGSAAGEDGIGSFSFTGRTAMANNLTNNMGDNPMKEEMQPVIINDDMLNKLQTILNAIGITDHDIALGNVTLNDNGAIKVVRKLTGQTMEIGAAKKTCIDLLDALGNKLVGAQSADHQQIDEFVDAPEDSRFTYVLDVMGNVTIQDSETGKSIYLQGHDATEVIGELQMHGGTPEKEQNVLSQYVHVMENIEVTEDITMGGEVSAHSPASMLRTLQFDIDSMKSKLQNIRATAIKANDVTGKFASEMFQDEINTLERTLHDFLTKSEE